MNKTKKLVVIAIMAALTALFSQIAIPMVPVPINMAMFAVFVAGGLLGAGYGAISQLLYISIGLIGIPVFVGFNSGIGAIVGPTGGYIIGYVAAAAITGLIASITKHTYWGLVLGMIIGLFVCYSLGTAWYMILTKSTLSNALILCVLPFLIGDLLKIMLAALIVKRIRKAVLQVK